jgi:hypothetical protein
MSYAIELNPTKVVQNINLVSVSDNAAEINWADASLGKTKFVIDKWDEKSKSWVYQDSVLAKTTNYKISSLQQDSDYTLKVSGTLPSGEISGQLISFHTTNNFIQPPKMIKLSISVSGKGGVVSIPAGINCPNSCQKTFPEGSVITLTATPLNKRKFNKWSGVCSGKTVSCTVKLSKQSSASALFN